MGGVGGPPKTLWCRSRDAPSVVARHVTSPRLQTAVSSHGVCMRHLDWLMGGLGTCADGSALRSRQSLIDGEYSLTLFIGSPRYLGGDDSMVAVPGNPFVFTSIPGHRRPLQTAGLPLALAGDCPWIGCVAGATRRGKF